MTKLMKSFSKQTCLEAPPTERTRNLQRLLDLKSLNLRRRLDVTLGPSLLVGHVTSSRPAPVRGQSGRTSLVWFFCLHSKHDLWRSEVRRSHVRVPPAVQQQEARSCCVSHPDRRSGRALHLLACTLTGLRRPGCVLLRP